MVDNTKINAFITALTNKFENKQSNKKSDISGDFSSDTSSYPTVQAVKTFISSAISGKVDAETGKGLSTNDYTDAEKTKLAGIEAQANKTVVDSSLSSSSENPVQNKVINTALGNKANSADLATVATTGAYSDLSGTPDLTDYVVTVEKQQTAETGYLSTYVVKQDGTQVGSKINIPKDFLVKSASVETVDTEDEPVEGYEIGDKYLDFVINSKDNSGTDEHLYVLVSDLIDTYTADNSTLTLSNNQFSIKSGGVGTTQLADSAVTTAKIDASAITTAKINDSAVTSAKINDGAVTSDKISSTVKSTWLSTSDVDSEIEEYLDALTTALS